MGKGLPRSLSRGSKSQQIVSKLTIPLQNLAVSVTATGVAIGFGTAVIGDFPEAQIKMLGAAMKAVVSGPGASSDLVDTWSGDIGIGTTPASDATITGADVNIIGSTAVGPAVAEISPEINAINGTDAVFDNTDGSLEVNLNLLIDAADIADDTTVAMTVDGVVEITYITLLDD